MVKLSTDLDNYKRSFKKGMEALANGSIKLKGIPVFDRRDWFEGQNNCYNFALNRQTDDYLHPGRINDPSIDKMDQLNLEQYAADTYNRVLEDGLRDLGQDFAKAAAACNDNERPIALFFRDNPLDTKELDFHWYSLMRDSILPTPTVSGYIWAHKLSENPARLCEDMIGGNDLANIFKDATDYGYDYFAGYFAVPSQLEVPPPERVSGLRQNL